MTRSKEYYEGFARGAFGAEVQYNRAPNGAETRIINDYADWMTGPIVRPTLSARVGLTQYRISFEAWVNAVKEDEQRRQNRARAEIVGKGYYWQSGHSGDIKLYYRGEYICQYYQWSALVNQYPHMRDLQTTTQIHDCDCGD